MLDENSIQKLDSGQTHNIKNYTKYHLKNDQPYLNLEIFLKIYLCFFEVYWFDMFFKMRI